jgi:hypothetical protein
MKWLSRIADILYVGKFMCCGRTLKIFLSGFVSASEIPISTFLTMYVQYARIKHKSAMH